MLTHKYDSSWGQVGWGYYTDNTMVKLSSDGNRVAMVYQGNVVIREYSGSGWNDVGSTGVTYGSDLALSKNGQSFANKADSTWTIYDYRGGSWVPRATYTGDGFDFGSLSSRFAVGNGEIKIYGSNIDSCHDCDAGQYQNEIDQWVCKKCESGKYQSETGKGFCNLCGSGKHQNSLGQPSCSLCTSGKYQDQFGQQTCKSCREGRYGRSGDQVTFDACDPCDPGFYQKYYWSGLM